MKKYPKIVQCDSRGQIVIPKEIRHELDIDEGTGFFMYVITDEGILLKKIEQKELNHEEKIITKISEKSTEINLKKENINKTIEQYKKKTKQGLDLI